ncbi:uncharacterized protein LOC144174745 [Haemaphysalis longicornis]
MMATGVIVNYQSPGLHNSPSDAFKQHKELCLRQSKSDSLLAMLSTNSLHSCSDQGQDCWRAGIEDLTREQCPLRQGAGAVTLESIKINLNTCFTCGVNWSEEHISLDCAECGGYAMQRPCLLCNGSCGQVWSRDLAASHNLQRAEWLGECLLAPRGAAFKNQNS